jgi:serine/threonine-protein kinase RsbW
MSDRLSLIVVNDLSEIPRVAREIEAFCQARGIASRIVHRFNLALEEVLTNVVSYAFAAPGRHVIDVAIVHDSEALTATVSDDGTEFDPLARPTPDLQAPMEQRRVGGLGIHLVRELSESVGYTRENGRNVLTFRMRTG